MYYNNIITRYLSIEASINFVIYINYCYYMYMNLTIIITKFIILVILIYVVMAIIN